MSETFRGPPTEDGFYIILTRSGERSVQRVNGRYFWTGTTCDCCWSDADILAHRKHEPLVVPELKKLHKCEGKPRVVSIEVEGAWRKGVMFATLIDGSLVVHSTDGVLFHADGNDQRIKFLTREQCEAAGYCYPPECEGAP